MDETNIWRFCVKKNYSAAYADYWTSNRVCEACRAAPSEPPHHIRTRGAGGDDSADNMIALCLDCHTRIHKGGRTVFCKLYPHLKAKVDAALARPRA